CGPPPGSSPGASSAPLQFDYMVRLYHFRQAAAIAAALNKAGGGSDLVEPVGAGDDLLMICPGPDGQPSRVARAVAIIDLPRPQLSLEVWSYQISSESKHEREKDQAAFDRATLTQKYYSDLREEVLNANLRMTKALQGGLGRIFAEVWANPNLLDPDFTN